jgi:hypothetical protein
MSSSQAATLRLSRKLSLPGAFRIRLRAMMLATISLLALGACGESKGQDVAACQNEAVKVYPNWRQDMGALAGDMGDFTRRCMKAKG